MPAQAKWENYEELTRYVVCHFADLLGISLVEAKQKIEGRSGTAWEIDAKGVCADGGFLVIECKDRSSTRLNQAVVGSLAFCVQDTGATGAVIVTSIGLQEGADKVARHLGFHTLYLPSESAFEGFIARCLNRVLAKPRADHVGLSVSFLGGSYTRIDEENK
ncbi:MAG: hypothetical protein EPO07_06500 [Verrucomicrobia bacterium]|nr:MAG: hypothetical protein EPO07_06500 [Verrucomicrobiota bacterium]